MLSSAYTTYRPLLLSIAYRMLGSVSDAEDVVQDVFVTLSAKHAVAGDEEEEHQWKPYLCKIVTNRCLDLLRSARRKRELYVGPWLPEPLVQELPDRDHCDPLQTIELEDSISYAVMVMLQHLTPTERAVFILREAFGFAYSEIGEILGKTELGCRKIYSRLRKKIQGMQPEEDNVAEASELLHRFMHAAISGDLGGLIDLMHEDIAAQTDGGGKIAAATRVIASRPNVAAFIMGLAKRLDETTRARPVLVNGLEGLLVVSQDGLGDAVISLAFRDHRIQHIYMVRNPDKLRHIRLG
ncbi:RNA polymerase sigma factor SigJ [Paenibacillus daejeonensis]|uniref:RNA polymerase sigma factor SigJ n=1 Tax=Paenibacillus daejeonensis TaxID=135193 RepID=UPI0003716C04|nr:RNA polymerase sigma factor SigJ [Paenibacillus daejeonensis]